MLIRLEEDAPQLAEGVYVAPTAVLIGKVRAAAGCSFWFGSVVRADNEWITFEEGSNLQDGCVCHADAGVPLTVGPHCTIGHGAILHGCTLENHVLIGMGARVLNHAHVEPEVMVAAGALVPERVRLKSGWLYMGAPARQARTLKPSEREWLRYASDHYQKQARRYLTTASIT